MEEKLKVKRYTEQGDIKSLFIDNDIRQYDNIITYCDKLQNLIDIVDIIEAKKFQTVISEIKQRFMEISLFVTDNILELDIKYNKIYIENIDFENNLNVIKLLKSIIDSKLTELKRTNFQNTLIVLLEKSDYKYDKLIIDKLKKEFT